MTTSTRLRSWNSGTLSAAAVTTLRRRCSNTTATGSRCAAAPLVQQHHLCSINALQLFACMLLPVHAVACACCCMLLPVHAVACACCCLCMLLPVHDAACACCCLCMLLPTTARCIRKLLVISSFSHSSLVPLYLRRLMCGVRVWSFTSCFVAFPRTRTLFASHQKASTSHLHGTPPSCRLLFRRVFFADCFISRDLYCRWDPVSEATKLLVSMCLSIEETERLSATDVLMALHQIDGNGDLED